MKVKHTTLRVELMRMIRDGELSYTYETAGRYLWRRRPGQPYELLRGQDARIRDMQRAGLVEKYRVFLIHRGHLPILLTTAGLYWLAEVGE